MFENIYAWLLQLYPSRFREEYGGEILQLFRDRAGDEKGFWPRLRLWLDLVADLAISVPREYYYFEPELLGASADQRLGGIPSFVVIEGGSPRPGALFSGGVLTMLVLSTCSIFLSQAGHYTPRRTFMAASSQSHRYKDSSAFGGQASPSGTEGGNSTSPFGRSVVSGRGPGASETSNSQSESLPPDGPDSSQPQTQRPEGTGNGGVIHSAKGSAQVDATERRRVIRSAVTTLKEHYVYPDVAQKISNELTAREKNGDYDGVKEGRAFAILLTKQMRDTSQDMHLDVVYSQEPLPEHLQGPSPESMERYREFIEHENCTFRKVEILPHHIGYLKLNSFPDVSVCEATARAAMSHLNDAYAIIFDLRENRGGDPEMVMLLAAYLFDHPEYMYNPRENTTQQSWTRSPVAENKLADKPAYILTSGLTSSAAEHFSYDLKMLKRATLVGETTSGAAHSGVFHRIDEHFGMGIPETKPINPFSKSDWAVVGVEPDVKVKAEDALETAIKLAQTKLPK
jgi:peptidase S41-like protein